MQGEEQYLFFCMQKEKWEDAGNIPYQLHSSPQTGSVQDHSFQVTRGKG